MANRIIKYLEPKSEPAGVIDERDIEYFVKIGDRQGYERGKAESDQSVHESAVRVGLIVGFFVGMFATLFIQWWRVR